MISQKVMKFFILSQQQNGAMNIQNQAELRDSIQQFDDNLFTLIDFPLNTQDISDQLEKVRLLWHHFKSALHTNDYENSMDLNNQVLAEMNNAVLLYVKLAGQEV